MRSLDAHSNIPGMIAGYSNYWVARNGIVQQKVVAHNLWIMRNNGERMPMPSSMLEY